jgi:hypothetical protein
VAIGANSVLVEGQAHVDACRDLASAEVLVQPRLPVSPGAGIFRSPQSITAANRVFYHRRPGFERKFMLSVGLGREFAEGLLAGFEDFRLDLHDRGLHGPASIEHRPDG